MEVRQTSAQTTEFIGISSGSSSTAFPLRIQVVSHARLGGSCPVSYKCITSKMFSFWNSSDLSKSISRSWRILDSRVKKLERGSVQAGENVGFSVAIVSAVSVRLTKKALRLSLEGAAFDLVVRAGVVRG